MGISGIQRVKMRNPQHEHLWTVIETRKEVEQNEGQCDKVRCKNPKLPMS
jgi:hypothetical protein